MKTKNIKNSRFISSKKKFKKMFTKIDTPVRLGFY